MSILHSNHVMTTDENSDRNKHTSLTVGQKTNIFETSSSKPPLILIVDDDSFMRKILVRYLERENYRVVEATNGMEALKIYQEFHPDIILLDAMMPVLDDLNAVPVSRSCQMVIILPY